ncbi:MAG: acetyl-CoA carboxylase carboxyltransferase subunit alpha [bacterium]
MAELPKGMLDFEKPLIDLYKKVDELKRLSKGGKINLSAEITALEQRIEHQKKELFSNLSPLQTVSIARHVLRPTMLDLVKIIFTDFMELHGDRNFADDPAMVGGIAKLDRQSVMIVGQQKGNNTKENIYRRWGMANPEGYRKALRLMQMAERFNKPVITFIDVPGAYPGIEGEERSVAEAIARNLREMSQLEVPMIVVITGEGGSGGALGIGVGDKVLMLEFSIYSVISPEGCASILFRNASKAGTAAESLKITSKDLLELGIIDEIIKEPAGGAHNNMDQTAKNIKTALLRNIKELKALSKTELVEKRYKKFRSMGIFEELSPL